VLERKSLTELSVCDRSSPGQAVLAKYNVDATDTTIAQMLRAFVVRALLNWSKRPSAAALLSWR